MTWNADQYLKYAQPRLRPALDLLNRIGSADPKQVYDLGCGAGNVTRMLLERWPGASITGIDDSAEMLAHAATQAGGIHWVNQNIAAWKPDRRADVIYSNAALHWLPNHRELFPALVGHLAPGGVLAVQMPRNFSAPSHLLVAETVHAGSWRRKLEHLVGPAPVADPPFYYELLAPLAGSIDIWESEYLQVLQGPDPVKEWVKGSWLKQFLDCLDVSERSAFETDYAQRLRVAYPPQASGETLFPFRRLFIVLQSKI
jgi:trans-aconitate 2-methyltransferase